MTLPSSSRASVSITARRDRRLGDSLLTTEKAPERLRFRGQILFAYKDSISPKRQLFYSPSYSHISDTSPPNRQDWYHRRIYNVPLQDEAAAHGQYPYSLFYDNPNIQSIHSFSLGKRNFLLQTVFLCCTYTYCIHILRCVPSMKLN